MDNRDFELFSTIVKERQDEIRRELENQHVLRGASAPTGAMQKLLIALLGILVVAMVAGIWAIG